MSDSRIFVDTNILVYAYDVDAGEKHAKASAILSTLWTDRTGTLSTQILHEFYVTVTRKLPKPLSRRTARDILETYGQWAVYSPVAADVVAASRLEESHRLAFWDALVVVAAQRSDAAVLLSEDLQDGRRIEGLRISNPLL
jgi:predicted nucleic acid-binding protein